MAAKKVSKGFVEIMTDLASLVRNLPLVDVELPFVALP
jgi:hypothetical protein